MEKENRDKYLNGKKVEKKKEGKDRYALIFEKKVTTSLHKTVSYANDALYQRVDRMIIEEDHFRDKIYVNADGTHS